MQEPILVVPGFHGSGPDHWQTWFERRLPSARRIGGVDWEQPYLAKWADAIEADLRAAAQPTWIVAHSFGCLASVVAIARAPELVRGAMLVAPADPRRFTAAGSTGCVTSIKSSIADLLPQHSIGALGVLVASRNDPWISFAAADAWADRWGLTRYDAGPVGHINAESGHGRWDLPLELLAALRRALIPRSAPPRVALARDTRITHLRYA